MSERMTDERLAELTRIVFPKGVNIAYDLVSELLQALTAERELYDNYHLRSIVDGERISELQAEVARLREHYTEHKGFPETFNALLDKLEAAEAKLKEVSNE